ncbi:MAG: methyltransferase domain-containing protein [Acidimicrobiia bacterium]|nr:methyltransferase domain-containing protein [Acidimicrobiia bacterium]
MEPDPEVVGHYEDRYDEDTRLTTDGFGQLELVRTRAILARHLPPPPAAVLDVGGGPGIYAADLNQAGYDVELIDIVPRHIREATERGVRAQLGDGRKLPTQTDSQDAVLLLGPLYHLPEREDRLAVLGEATRVGRAGAPVFAAAISRFASAIDGLASAHWDDPDFVEIVLRDLEDGKHLNPTGNPGYFTTAFFHRPADLRDEFLAAGLTDVEVIGVEGIGWAAIDIDERMADEAKRASLLELLERLETEESILGASPHLLAVGRIPG